MLNSWEKRDGGINSNKTITANAVEVIFLEIQCTAIANTVHNCRIESTDVVPNNFKKVVSFVHIHDDFAGYAITIVKCLSVKIYSQENQIQHKYS